MNIPQLSTIKTAVELYYSFPTLGTKEIRSLFICNETAINELKKAVKLYMVRNEIPFVHTTRVDTPTAFKVWQLDIAELEKRLKKLREIKP